MVWVTSCFMNYYAHAFNGPIWKNTICQEWKKKKLLFIEVLKTDTVIQKSQQNMSSLRLSGSISLFPFLPQLLTCLQREKKLASQLWSTSVPSLKPQKLAGHVREVKTNKESVVLIQLTKIGSIPKVQNRHRELETFKG